MIGIVVLIYGSYWGYGKITSTAGETRYILAAVEKGTIIASVSGSGKVSTSDQMDIKPKASGDIIWVGVKAGDVVRAGQTIAQIDSTTARQAIADAEQTLTQAKLQYQKDSAQAPIDYQKSIEAVDDAKKTLNTTYNDTFNSVSDAYLALPTVMTGLQNTIYSTDLSANKSQSNLDVIKGTFINSSSDYEVINTISNIAERDYKLARAQYDLSLAQYKLLTRYSASAELEKTLNDSVNTMTSIAQSLQSILNLLDTTIDRVTQQNRNIDGKITALRSNAQTYLSTTNSKLSALLSQQKSIDSSKKTIRDNERNLEILKIGNTNGDNPISLQSSANSIANQERNLQEQKDNLSYYNISSPFSGTLATLNIKKYDSVSTGTNVATLIANQKIAELSLNEVDVAKIKIGDKVTLTFDAIENFTLTGKVTEINAIGTVSQGVVSYTLKISFDSQDDRIKSGMTVNASIQTNVKQDVLIVSSSAVKSQNSASFVLVFNPALTNVGGTQGVLSKIAPTQVKVTTGISDDTNVEILSGLSEGQQIVTRAISGTATAKITSATNSRGGGFGAPGIRL